MLSSHCPKKRRLRTINALRHKESFIMKIFIPQALILAGFYFVVYAGVAVFISSLAYQAKYVLKEDNQAK